jgi:hypothetical protein
MEKTVWRVRFRIENRGQDQQNMTARTGQLGQTGNGQTGQVGLKGQLRPVHLDRTESKDQNMIIMTG